MNRDNDLLNTEKAKEIMKNIGKMGRKYNCNITEDLSDSAEVITEKENNSKIIGIENLTTEQQEHIENVNKKHTECNWPEVRSKMKIVKAWIDEDGVTCVELLNGDWYHYYSNGTWG